MATLKNMEEADLPYMSPHAFLMVNTINLYATKPKVSAMVMWHPQLNVIPPPKKQNKTQKEIW